MNGFERDYFSNLEEGTEESGGEKDIERIDYSSQVAKSDKEYNIADATISSLETLSDLMELGEDVEAAVKVAIEGREEVIKKLMKEGRLNNICDDLKNKINEYLEAAINKEQEKYDEGR